jgi:hypothetical protein
LAYSVDIGVISNPGDLYVGFLDSKSTGPSFDSLEFKISSNVGLLKDYTFNNVTDAKVFFDDHTLCLGSLYDAIGNDTFLNMFFDFTLVGSKNSGFDFNFVFYDPPTQTPLPPSVFLLGSGLMGLGLLGWRRRRG